MNFKDMDVSSQILELILKYEFAMKSLETQIYILIKEFEFTHHYNPVEHIKSRIKSKESVLKKLEKKGYDLTPYNIMNNIHDMIGIRIVCSFLSDVYDIVNIIKNYKQIKVKEEKDYIKNPKNSGYISYHLIVLVPLYLNDTIEYIEAEIQVRTIAMDFWASLDHKIQYKIPKELPKKVKNDIYECSLVIKNLDQKMNELNQFIEEFEYNYK
jgi:putative GTP pyrophosphokinase